MQSLRITFSRAAVVAALAFSSLAHSQASAPAAPIDAEKQKLIDHILTLWHPENGVVMAVQRPASETMEKAHIALQQSHMPADKVDKNMKDVSIDVQKYIDTATPIATASAKKHMATSVVPLLAQNFTNDELKQLIALLESPVKAKFEKVVPLVNATLGKQVQDEVGPTINKDIDAMTQAVGTKLRIAVTAATN